MDWKMLVEMLAWLLCYGVLSFAMKWLKKNAKKQDYELAEKIIDTTVKSVEQISKDTGEKNVAKKVQAITVIKEVLKNSNIKIDESFISTAIEAVVHNMNKEKNTKAGEN